MSSSGSSQPIQKPLHFKPKPEVSYPDPIISRTPEKQPLSLPRRARNTGVALSIKEVRKAAQTRPQQHRTDQIESARKQIVSWPAEHAPPSAAGGSSKLPEKYRQLIEFFDSLDSTIRLLKLKRSMSTFTNICPKIECLTDRRFSYGHLGQLKFILPDVIEIKKVLIFDEKTSCMKPDLHVTINVDAIECDGKSKSESKHMNLRKVFRARLMDFLKDHPEGDEIPEETLPELFNYSKSNSHSNVTKIPASSTSNESSACVPTKQQESSATCQSDMHLKVIKAPSMSLVTQTSTCVLKNQQPTVAYHISQSFRRHFSQKCNNNEAEKAETEKKGSDISNKPSIVPVIKSCLKKISSEGINSATAPPNELPSEPISSDNSYGCVLPNCPPATPIKDTAMKNEDVFVSEVAGMESTPAKLASTPARLMTSTPALNPPKRCYMTPEDVSTISPNKLVRRPLHIRSLKFDTPVKNQKVEGEGNETEGISVDDDNLSFLSEKLLQSIREKEKKAVEERDPAISQAKRRRQMIACLPKLFNMIHFLFQSIRRSVITKEELIHKIISSHCDIIDRREVEEQMNLLLELVPEWISEKLASGGDLLVCINKMSSPESIRARLEEAK